MSPGRERALSLRGEKMDQRRQSGSGAVSYANIPYVNMILIAVNVVIFVAGIFLEPVGAGAESMFLKGALYAPLILKGQGFYRLVTSIFLHADASHLVNNMIMQFAGGEIVERNMGHARYLLLYFFSGIGGNLASVLSDYMSRSYGYSIGASGAVFGVTGALLYMIFREAASGIRRETEAPSGGNGLSPQMKSLVLRAVLMTVWLLYSGWRNPVINQAAHVGGLLSGFLFAAVLMPKGKRDISVLIR